MISATSLTGAAGEHFVMSELLRRNMIAALAPAGVPNCDIVVTDDIGDRLCAVQVKTRNSTGRDGGWHMGKKHEMLVAPTLFYCFVDFAMGKDCAPFTYVVPAAVVAKALAECHQAGRLEKLWPLRVEFDSLRRVYGGGDDGRAARFL